jgi:protein TonB
MELQTTIEDKKTNFEYLGNEHFALTLVATLLLHILAGYGIYSMPKAKILDIPVRMLNIRLGDADMQEEEATQPQPISENSQQLENEMARLSRPEQQKETPPKPTPPKQEKQPVVNNTIPAPRQFVRTNAADNVPKNEGIAIGNSSAKNAEIKANYEQTVSLWIKKFQVYPEEARQKGYVGTPVVRVRFDRRGNIRYTVLESSSGYDELDRAALDMVRRANPVPAVPDDYPQGGDLLEFLLPVIFK